MRIEQADEQDFAELSEWRYEIPYDFYDGDVDPVLNAERYFVARDEDDELIGFYYFEPRGDELEYGLGLRPGLVGRGHGLEFVRVGLEFGRSLYAPTRIVLNVAAFNIRAIKVYERAAFHETDRHVRSFDRFGDVEFITMEERV